MSPSSDPDDLFDQQLLDCTVDLNGILPRLAARYSAVAVIAALATHVGGGLKICLESGVCTADQARNLLERLERLAFDKDCVPPRARSRSG
jgi:chorismate mutase